MTNVADLARLAAARWPDREAVIHGSRRHTFAEVAVLTNEAAAYLEGLGIGPKDPVVTIGRNSDQLLVTYLALAALGAVNVPLHPFAGSGDLAEAAERTGAKLLLHDEDAAARVEEVAVGGLAKARLDVEYEVADGFRDALASPVGGDDDLAMVIFTSGSSNKPKACAKTHGNLLGHSVGRQLTMPRRPGERELYTIPLSGIGFANFVLVNFLAGTTVMLEAFDAGVVLEALQREKITYTFLPPTMLHAVLAVPGQEDVDTSALTRIDIGYELPIPLRNRLIDRFGPIFYFGYGSTEGTSSYATPAEFMDDPQCVGVVHGLDEIRVVDETGVELPEGETGEIVARGPSVMREYLGDKELTATTMRGGWYHTGDLGYFGPGKKLHFAGRIKDMIKTGGMNVAAAEVEGVLAEFSGCDQVAVIGVEDERWGQAVVAAIVASPGTDLDRNEISAFAGERLSGYKRPKEYVFLPELPLNAAGKVAKPELLEIVLATRSAGARS